MEMKTFLFQTNIKKKGRNSCIIYLSSLLPFGNDSFDFVMHIFIDSILHIFIESSERKNDQSSRSKIRFIFPNIIAI